MVRSSENGNDYFSCGSLAAEDVPLVHPICLHQSESAEEEKRRAAAACRGSGEDGSVLPPRRHVRRRSSETLLLHGGGCCFGFPSAQHVSARSKSRDNSSLGDPSSIVDYGPKVLALIIKYIDLDKLEVLIKSLSFDTMEMGYPMLAHCLDVLFAGTRAQIGSGGGDGGSGGGGGSD
ncbi:hypothetical protein OROMI_032856 [Orobanche minor]